MKKYAIFVLLMFVFPAAYSQESKEPEALIKEVKQLSLVNIRLEKELQASKDSIKRIDSISKLTVKSLNKKIGDLENEKADLNKQIKKLDKNNIKGLEASILDKTDSIRQLRKVIKNKDSLITVTQNEIPGKEQKKFEEGQQIVYDKIGKTYQNTFDYLIKYSTKQSVERDSQFVVNNAEAEKNWQALQIYFAAQQIFKEKYDEQKLKNAQTQLNSVTQKSDLLDELKKKFLKYKLYSDSLKTTITSIINYDKKFVANNEELQKAKQQHILLELSSYFHNYHFNYTDYPYLADIILEIMKLKQKDANTDISHLSSKL